jgi:predicted ribonuclease toxin of YeeF-YezG toxin-antitoxin module
MSDTMKLEAIKNFDTYVKGGKIIIAVKEWEEGEIVLNEHEISYHRANEIVQELRDCMNRVR